MKKRKIANILRYCILATIWGVLIASLFVGCNLYEKEEIEIIRCPEIKTDTIKIPDWDKYSESYRYGQRIYSHGPAFTAWAARTVQSRSGGLL